MLPKKNRVEKKNIDLLFKEGRFFVSPSLTFKFILNNSKNKPKISFIAPKSIAKLAVYRNSLRRRGYRVLNNLINQFPLGLVGVFIFRKKEEDNKNLENEIKTFIDKIN